MNLKDVLAFKASRNTLSLFGNFLMMISIGLSCRAFKALFSSFGEEEETDRLAIDLGLRWALNAKSQCTSFTTGVHSELCRFVDYASFQARPIGFDF